MSNIAEYTPQNRPHPHILIFPYPAQGHILPLLDLTHQLALHNLAITILITPKNLPILNPILSIHPSIKTLVLPFPSHPKIPLGIENLKDLGILGNLPMVNALSKLQDQIIHWFKSHPNPPSAIISDTFLGWTLNLAHLLQIPRITFYPNSALLASIYYSLWKDFSVVQSEGLIHFPDIPGSPSFKEDHLPSIYRICKQQQLSSDAEFVREGLIANYSSWGIICNSFEALEDKNFNYLKNKLGHDRIYGLGPVGLSGVPDKRDLSNNDILKWLDGCPDGSVVYACFGSQKCLKRQQIEALAFGLEKSGTRFIWVIKTGTNMTREMSNESEFLPYGFEERVDKCKRGLVIKEWVPQVLILSHRAVGGFLCHFGWNSTLEGLVAGVTILGWPMEADHFVNAKIFAEQLGVAVTICEGDDSVPDSDELGKLIGESMSERASVKVRVKDFRNKALEAVKDGGSSIRELDEFVNQLRMLSVTK